MVNNPEIEDDLVARLRAGGVPEHVVRYVAGFKIGRVERILAGTLACGLLLAVICIVGFLLVPLLHQLARDKAWSDAYFMQSLLWRSHFGVSILFVLIAGMLWALPLAGLLFTRLPPQLQVAAFAMNFDPVAPSQEGMATSIRRGMLWLGGDERDPQDFISKSTFGLTRPVVLSAAAATVVAVGVTLWDSYGRTIVTPEYLAQSSLVLPYQLIMNEWADATGVEVGCNTYRNTHGPIYRVRFKDNRTVDLWQLEHTKESWLDSVEPIDAILRKSGATFTISKMDSSCVDHFRAVEKPQDFARSQKLLSVAPR